MSNVSRPTWMVVGGTGNVGRHVVLALLGTGAAVAVPSRDRTRLEALRQFVLPAETGSFIPVVADMTDAADATRALAEVGPLDGAVVSLGGFVHAPSTLAAPVSDLERVLRAYLFAHHAVAQSLVPHLRQRDAGYIMINGPLAFNPLFPGAGLVSIATAAQAMLARVLMSETADAAIRINEVVIHSSFGWGNDENNAVTGADIGRYIAHLLSREGAEIRQRTIHLTPDVVAASPALQAEPT